MKRYECWCDSGLPAVQQAPVVSGISLSPQSLPWPWPLWPGPWPLCPHLLRPAPAPCVPATMAFLSFLPRAKHVLLGPWALVFPLPEMFFPQISPSSLCHFMVAATQMSLHSLSTPLPCFPFSHSNYYFLTLLYLFICLLP